MSTNLFAGDSDSNEENLELKLNKEYAKSYNKFRQKELYQKLKDQDKNNSDSSSSSDSESTDEENEITDPKFDKEFFKTLSSLKSRDPKIYDKKTNFFENVTNDNADLTKSKKSNKPLTLKDYERKVILENNGKFEDDSDFEGNHRSPSPTYVEDERKLKEEFKNVMNNNDDSENEEFGGIFKKRQKTNEEMTKQEEEYTKWLAGEEENIEESTKRTLFPLKEYWNNPKLSKQEKFLRDYILNKGYANKDCHEIPTYDEIIGDDDDNLSEDEKDLEKQAEFEQKYNFRYEEPDKEFIKRYPRTIENSVRKTNDNRREKRLELKERKTREKEEKMKNLEILKELKRQEIEDKIKKLKEVTGNDELAFQNDEFDNDFDPDAHDRKMKEIFNDDYYGIEEDGEEKPECPDIDELKFEDWDNYDPDREDAAEGNDNIPNCEDDDFIMDCDYNPNSKDNLQNELIENTKSRRKRNKKHNQFKEMIQKEKPVFNPEDEKTYAEYIDEYYKMDCEDMIGDLPCRFKYVETVPNDFGLTIEEILLAKNKELNQWASLKKSTQIRSEHVEKNERKLYQLKAQNLALKKKIFSSLYESSGDEEENKEDCKTAINIQVPSKNKGKNKKRKPLEISVDGKKEEKKLKVDIKKANLSVNELIVPENKDITTKNNPTESEKLQITKKKKKNKKKKQNTNSSNEIMNTKNPTKNLVTKNKKLETTSKQPSALNPFKTNKSSNGKLNENNKFKEELNEFKKTNKLMRNLRQNSNNNKNDFNKNKIKHINFNKSNEPSISDERLKAYGINPKKFHKKQNYLTLKNKVNIKKDQNLNKGEKKEVNKIKNKSK